MHASTASKPNTKSNGRDAISPDVDKAKAKPAGGTAKPATPRVSHAKDDGRRLPELPVISTVKLVPLALIDIEAQVRTVFDEDGIRELADDIGARGLLQPVLLNPRGARFTLIAGERRVRACKLLELSDVPALITKASSGDVLLMQLAENIQREALDLQDEVNAVRQMHEVLGTVKAVAETVKKSPAWVSKRLALSHPDLSWTARQLMEDGITEDIEILNAIEQLCGIRWALGQELAAKLRRGEVTRDDARKALAEAKATNPKPLKMTMTGTPAELEAERQRLNEEYAQQRQQARKEQEEGTGEAFVAWAWVQLERACIEPDEDQQFQAAGFFDGLREDQREALQRHLIELAASAKAASLQDWAVKLNYDGPEHTYDYLSELIAIATLTGLNVAGDFRAFLTLVEQANRDAVA